MHIAFFSPRATNEFQDAWQSAEDFIQAFELTNCSVHDVSAANLTLDEGKEEAHSQVDRFRNMAERRQPMCWVSHGISPDARDPVGPLVCRELGIPYVLVEPILNDGSAAEQLRSTLEAASIIVSTNSAVVQELRNLVGDSVRLVHLPPFLDLVPYIGSRRIRDRHRAAMGSRLRFDVNATWLIAGGPYSEPGLEAYRFLARSLSRIVNMDWSLAIVGEGSGRDELVKLFCGFPPGRVNILEGLADDERIALLVSGDLYLWPTLGFVGANSLMEAQAAGMPVIACKGTASVDRVLDNVCGKLAAADNPESFANWISFLLRNRKFLTTYTEQVKDEIDKHGIREAGRELTRVLEELPQPT